MSEVAFDIITSKATVYWIDKYIDPTYDEDWCVCIHSPTPITPGEVTDGGDAKPRTTNQPPAEKLAAALSVNADLVMEAQIRESDHEAEVQRLTSDRDRLAAELATLKASVAGKVVIDIATAMAAIAACNHVGRRETTSALRDAYRNAKGGE